jgi:aminopeptidase N
MVGNNQYEHAFIDEGLTNFVTTIYFREMYGDEKADEQVDRNLKLWYLTMLFGAGEDQVVDQPTDDFPSQGHYGSTIYGKAALGFGAIHDAIGDDAFFAALTDYAAEFRFKVATPADLRAAFERASGQDLGERWRHWFEATEGEHDFNAAEYARLRREYGR